MKAQHVFRCLSVLLMIFVTLAAASPVSADTHIQNVTDMEGHSVMVVNDPVDPSPCSFDIDVYQHGNLRDNIWINENGQVTKEILIYGNVKKEWSAHGKTVDVQAQGPIKYHYQYGPEENKIIVKVTGASEVITIPGHGKIYGGGGQINLTYTFQAGSWNLISITVDRVIGNINLDAGPLCEYLGS
jgi:hypothetical protein